MMLGPPTETVRRPSSTSDLILSRTDSLLPRDSLSPGDRHHGHLSPSDGSYSAPLSASPSSCWTTTGAAATSGSDCSLSSTPRASPEARKRYWCRRLMKLKEEMDRVGDGFRRSLRGSFDTLTTRLSSSSRRQSRNGDSGCERLQGSGINVDIVREVRRKRTKSADRSRGNSFRLGESSGGGDDAGRPSSDFNVPSTLTLTGLRDGAFSGEIPLESSTAAKSVIVRIRDYRLEFYVPGDGASSERSSQQLQFVGAVSLPIYVDPGSLAFSLNSPDTEGGGGVHRLLVDGRMKGCGAGVSDVSPRRLSVSTSDLSLLTSSPSRRQATNLNHW